jgi:hypothetical protein
MPKGKGAWKKTFSSDRLSGLSFLKKSGLFFAVFKKIKDPLFLRL